MAEVYNKVIIVDGQDTVIGAEDILVARERGLIRRAARVFVFNEKGEVLVQRRSTSVLHPLLLDQSVGGHVDEGETYREAAEREMVEELGLSGVPLDEVATSYRTPYHFNGIYRAVIAASQTISYNPSEVFEVIWYAPDDLTRQMLCSPNEFTSSFPYVWLDLRDKMIPS